MHPKEWIKSLSEIPQAYSWKVLYSSNDHSITLTTGDYTGGAIISCSSTLGPSSTDQSILIKVDDWNGHNSKFKEKLILHSVNSTINYFIKKIEEDGKK